MQAMRQMLSPHVQLAHDDFAGGRAIVTPSMTQPSFPHNQADYGGNGHNASQNGAPEGFKSGFAQSMPNASPLDSHRAPPPHLSHVQPTQSPVDDFRMQPTAVSHSPRNMCPPNTAFQLQQQMPFRPVELPNANHPFQPPQMRRNE
mmetsp:Transcript_23677/g.72371  ORF Transcript_23677/g.72371 Transcript_23677/m.72371 type:complete len:146 (-) Transcript_23677:372-809(-)|eukprot:scaffold299279_cov39-Tisochrysis_lutea.AAC.1